MLKGKKEIRERLLTMWPPMGDEKPTVVQRTIDYKDIPNKLRKNRQWVVWRYEKDDEGHDIVGESRGQQQGVDVFQVFRALGEEKGGISCGVPCC